MILQTSQTPFSPSLNESSFVALAYYVEPASVRPVTYRTCLCLSIPYTAPASGGWHRTIYLRLDPDTEPGTKMAITWTAVTDPAQFSLLPGEPRPGEDDAATRSTGGDSNANTGDPPEATIEIVAKFAVDLGQGGLIETIDDARHALAAGADDDFGTWTST